MEIKKNDDIKLYIESMTSEGAAVGHYHGIAVFVRGAVPGDEIIAHIIKVSKRYCIAVIKTVLKPSLSRIPSDCAASDKCGGCAFRNMTYAEELRYKQQRVADAMKRIGHLEVNIHEVVGADMLDGYRNKAQYPVAIHNGAFVAGFYAYKSHRLVPCENCRLQPAVFRACLQAFSAWANQAQITAYDEATGKGLLRHIYLRRAESTGELMACAVINQDTLPQSDLLVALLKEIDGMKSICVNINKRNDNVILGKKTEVLWGSEAIEDILLGKRFRISPLSFYQVNHQQCEKLYRIAAQYAGLTGKETVADIYCGTGTIGLTMAEKANRIFGIEIIPEAVENAKRNAALNQIENAEFFCGDALAGAQVLAKRGVQADVVILDPPRKGCEPALFDVIKSMAPKKIVYVSCDSATLARDLAILQEKGYIAQEITPVDMFPRTPHVETVCCLYHQKKDFISVPYEPKNVE